MKKPILTYREAMAEPMESMRLSSFDESSESSVLREVMTLPSIGEVISIRAAKAHLSGLLDLVERGRDIIITSNGKPKARLVPLEKASTQKPFGNTREHLAKMPPWNGGKTADEIVREDRDGRGW